METVRVFPQLQGFEQQASSSWNKKLSGLENFSAAVLKIGHYLRPCPGPIDCSVPLPRTAWTAMLMNK